MTQIPRAFARQASRRAHLDEGNLLRSLTLVINGVPGGINLGQGVCDLDTPLPLRDGAIAGIDGGDRQLYTPYAGLPELRPAAGEGCPSPAYAACRRCYPRSPVSAGRH